MPTVSVIADTGVTRARMAEEAGLRGPEARTRWRAAAGGEIMQAAGLRPWNLGDDHDQRPGPVLRAEAGRPDAARRGRPAEVAMVLDVTHCKSSSAAGDNRRRGPRRFPPARVPGPGAMPAPETS